jgi:hypothetical protein
MGKTGTIVLDAASGSTFLFGAATGQMILVMLGGLASIAAIINHTDAYLKRRKAKNE